MIQFRTFVSRVDSKGRRYAMHSNTPNALAAIMSGDAAEVRAFHWGVLRATLSKNDGRFIMFSHLTGTHSLDVASTDAKRLAAHWRGFLNSQRELMP